MTASESPVDGGSDRAVFETDLTALINQARNADVDLRGAYDVKGDDGTVEYTVEISAVKRPSAE